MRVLIADYAEKKRAENAEASVIGVFDWRAQRSRCDGFRVTPEWVLTAEFEEKKRAENAEGSVIKVSDWRAQRSLRDGFRFTSE